MASNSENRYLENVCRLCLTDSSDAGDMLPIFPIRGGNPNSPSSVVNRIQQCTSLKLEQKDGVPSSICELCSVRLEDWYAFREQCLGSDEYLRVALAKQFYSAVQTTQTATTSSLSAGSNTTPQLSVDTVSKGGIAARRQSVLPQPSGSTGPSPLKSSSLAKRRKSTFEWTLAGGKDTMGGQKVIVEVLGECGPTGEETSPKPYSDLPVYEAIPPPEHNGGILSPSAYGHRHSSAGMQNGVRGGLPASDLTTLLEEASWSKEYSARVNSLMLLVSGLRPFKCKICRKLFKARSNLRRHIKLSHSDEIVEGESPPPECYDFGHIHRAGGTSKPAGVEFSPPQALQQQQQQQQQQAVAVKRKRKSTDPPIVGPHRCQLCPRSFKMPAHLAVHIKVHQKVNEVQPELGVLEQQIQQQSPQPRTESRQSSVFSERSRKTDIEPCDIIQLSDDDEEEVQRQVKPDTEGSCAANGHSDELDDGFDEEEGSLKEGVPVEPTIERNTGRSPLSMTIRIGSRAVTEGHDVVPVVEKVRSGTPAPVNNAAAAAATTIVKPKAARSHAPGTIPPGPLSMKQRYRESMENGTVPERGFIIARPKQQVLRQPSPLTLTPRTSPATVVVETPAVAKLGGATATSVSRRQGSPVATHRCHFCQQKFPNEEQLRAHQKTHQTDGPFPFRCRWCQKGFRYRQNYTTHVEKQTCRLLNGEGLVPPVGGKLPPARLITANKRPW